jgi:hypothetical protein
MSSNRPTPPEPEPMSRRRQFAQAYTLARRTDARLPLWIAGAHAVLTTCLRRTTTE